MKKQLWLIVVLFVVGCGKIEAQRPVGDTTYVGLTPDYLFDSIHHCYFINLHSGGDTSYMFFPWNPAYNGDFLMYLWSQLSEQGEISFVRYPFLASWDGGKHLAGQEFQVTGEIKVIGLAVCPERVTRAAGYSPIFPDDTMLAYGAFSGHTYTGFKIVDTTIAGSETEYVQLYTMEGGIPHFQREGGWRWDDPHRYMFFTHLIYKVDSLPYRVQIIDTIYTPLYEVMFDTGVYVNNETIMLAVTHNNNDMVWTDTCFDTIYPYPHICWEHYPTAYTLSVCLREPPPPFAPDPTWWFKYESLPWQSYPNVMYSVGRAALNIFPILDTLFGTPCATVSNLQAAAVDSLWATVMWSADARHHEWDVEYWPTGQPSGSATMVADSVPTVTLTGLTPGTEYGVRVRGLCDKDNYSPWSDMLLFTTPQDTTPDTVMPPPDTLGIPAMGNLDRFTRMMPNPAGNWVSVLSSYRLKSVAVYDLVGRLMMEQVAEGLSATMDVSALPRGTYIVAIRTLQGVATKKLVVER